MFYKNKMSIAISLFVGLHTYAHEISFQGINQMNKKCSHFLTYDLLNNPIILEWEEIKGQTDMLSKKIKSLSSILVPSYTQTEVEFARQKPEEVLHDFMLKSLAPLLHQGVSQVDWKLFERKTKTILEQFFATMDWKKNSGVQDINIFVTVKDQTNKQVLGVIQFLIKPEFLENNVKAGLFGIIPSAQHLGLEKVLLSSIFRLQPNTKRIFLHTRSTNQQAIQDYGNLGFSPFKGSLPNWTDLEYLVDKSDTLQKIAKRFIIQN